MSSRTSSAPRLQDAEVFFLMPKEKFSKRFVEFVNENFDETKVAFMLYGSGQIGYEQSDAENVLCVGHSVEIGLENRYRSLLRSCRVVVMTWVDIRILALLRSLWPKIELVFWGGDIYRFTLPQAATNLKSSLSRRVLTSALSGVRGINTLTPGDKKVVEQLSAQHAPWHLVAMCGTTEGSLVEEETMLAEVRAARRMGGPKRILVGNSATVTNRHLPVLEQLARFADEDIEVYAPLSYGDDAYRAEVITAGHNLLGDRFFPLTEFMDVLDYKRFLASVDVGVFNHNRQQGMGNINMLQRFGAKVYISRDSVMWDDFKAQGLQFFATEDIEGCDFAQFVAYDEAMARKNAEVRDMRAARDRAVAQWAEVLQLQPQRGA